MFIDHFVWASPDLSQGMEQFYQLSGAMPQPGGSHPEKGTCNALVRLGDRSYLEILTPDPAQAGVEDPWMQIRGVHKPALIRWAWQTTDIFTDRGRWQALGWNPGQVMTGSRLTGDGKHLQWKLTDPDGPSGWILPFLIDWGNGPHPADLLPEGCQLQSIHIWYPEPVRLTFMKDLEDVSTVSVLTGNPRMVIWLNTPRGVISLKS